MVDKPCIHVLLAGGGTGGHIFPNMAIAEAVARLAQQRDRATQATFLISNRPLDRKILDDACLTGLVLDAAPLSVRPTAAGRFALGYVRARRAVLQYIHQLRGQGQTVVMVATGGFVSAPAVAAARRTQAPTALVNLDAVPGKANRMLARRVDAVFSCHPGGTLRGGRHNRTPVDESSRRQTLVAGAAAEVIGLPVRQAARATLDAAAARTKLSLDPRRPTLLVTAGSQGAATINAMMRQLVAVPRIAAAMLDWQVLHLCGPTMQAELEQAYKSARIPAKVLPFTSEMGVAWAAASLAISRAGASSVAEVWINATPTIFFPYPFHADNHQRLNAAPLTSRGAAMLCEDLKDAGRNVEALTPVLTELLRDDVHRERMRQLLRQSRPEDGAFRVARWVVELRDEG